MNTPTIQNIVVVGATGLIGSQVLDLLSLGAAPGRYEVMGVTHRTSPALNLEDPRSIDAFFQEIKGVDHVVVAAGRAQFGPIDSLDDEAFEIGLRSKLMGQVRIARAALQHLPNTGSVTLTSGQLSHHPIPGSSAVALVNGALEAFVRAVALDAPSGPRINVVSPGWIKETMVRMGLDSSAGTSARDVARLYLSVLQGDSHGQVIEHQ